MLRTLYSDIRLCTISGILRTLRHLQAYSVIIVMKTLTFFFNLILHTFQENLKKHIFDYNDVYLRIRWRLIRPLAMAGRVPWIRVSPSIRFSVQRFSWDWLISFFWNSARCQRPMWCCAWQNRIFEKKKKLLPQKWGKLAKNGPRIAFFLIYWKI